MIYTNKSKINSTLSANGFTRLNEDYYWSSTEYSSSKAWDVDMGSGYTYSDDKNYYYYVRAVSAF